MKTPLELSKEIEEELRHEYRGLRQTSNTNKSLSNIMALVEEIAYGSYQDGIDKGQSLTLTEYREHKEFETKKLVF